MTVYCSNCGSALPAASRFCSACGTVVSGYPPPGYATGFPPPAQRLERPLLGRQMAGVCAGLARNYAWDVGLVRVMAVIGGIFLFPLVEIAYLACWIGIPDEQVGASPLSNIPPNPPQS